MTGGIKRLDAPPGATARLSVFDAGWLAVPSTFVIVPLIGKHDVLRVPSLCFLIEHEASGKRVVFDLGWPKDWQTVLPPAILAQIDYAKPTITVDRDASERLTDAGVALDSIDAIIWSHTHCDHMGDPRTFPAHTRIVVGPGFDETAHTYPNNPEGLVQGSAVEGRVVEHLRFDDASASSSLRIGGLPAIDYFNDGSVYLLQAHGHTPDHIMALVRTTADTFALLGGDVCHHAGQMRPSAARTLPTELHPSDVRFDASAALPVPCPGALLAERYHPDKLDNQPFYRVAPGMDADQAPADHALERTVDMDGLDNVFVVIAHDAHVLDSLRDGGKEPTAARTALVPMNDWHVTRQHDKARWLFLADLVGSGGGGSGNSLGNPAASS